MWTDPRDEVAAAAVAPRGTVLGESLDPDAIAALFELGDADFFADLVDDFVTSTRTYLGTLEGALTSGDAESVYKAAHTMKSSAASMGAMTFSAMCRDVEAAGRTGDLGRLVDAPARLRDEFDRVRDDLEAQARRG